MRNKLLEQQWHRRSRNKRPGGRNTATDRPPCGVRVCICVRAPRTLITHVNYVRPCFFCVVTKLWKCACLRGHAKSRRVAGHCHATQPRTMCPHAHCRAATGLVLFALLAHRRHTQTRRCQRINANACLPPGKSPPMRRPQAFSNRRGVRLAPGRVAESGRRGKTRLACEGLGLLGVPLMGMVKLAGGILLCMKRASAVLQSERGKRVESHTSEGGVLAILFTVSSGRGKRGPAGPRPLGARCGSSSPLLSSLPSPAAPASNNNGSTSARLPTSLGPPRPRPEAMHHGTLPKLGGRDAQSRQAGISLRGRRFEP